MIAQAKMLVAPAYLLLCLLLGGSAQGIWANFILQLLAVAILAWAALTRAPIETTRAARTLWLLAALVGLLVAIQLVPLPPVIWTNLPGRDFVVQGLGLMEVEPAWRPISLAPYDTLATAQTLLPPIAMLAAMLRLGAFTDNRLTGALLFGAFASVALGMLQVASGGTDWYLYRFVNLGSATGFFANSNHMAALLLVSLPFVAAIAAERWNRARKTNIRAVILALGFGSAFLLSVGIVLAGSEAVMLLSVPVAAASALIVLRLSPRAVRRGGALVGGLILVAAGVAALLARDGLGPDQSTSVSSRVAIWSNTLQATADQLPMGSGLGTFPGLYPQYENVDLVDRYYVNHAHNEYLEIALETGLPGILLVILFLVWWGRRSVAAWRSPAASAHMKAASIASAALLLHSLVEFPLRTAALSTVLAMCVALLAFPRRQESAERLGDLRPSRHLTL